ncbi:hypothetical protein [Enemella dayhoffiae]|uniref:hypothetical protein n=1 Tax=Enemella dayhoffiae TaxID=2016507 RepID=UPI0011408EDF|nr:hypothetical protein [Enemella dayhoffiae]
MSPPKVLHPRPGRTRPARTRPARLDSTVPVLDRGDSTVQLGLEPGTILDPPAPGDWPAALRLLDGRTPYAEVSARTGVAAAALTEVVDQLGRLGLLTRPDSPAPPGDRVRLIGAGAIGLAVAEAYLLAEAGELQVVDPEPPDHALYPDVRPTAAESLTAHLRARRLGPVRVGAHWYDEQSAGHDLTVVASDTLECDRALTDTLLRQDRAHLLVRPLPDGVLIGPLVVPGQTCCTRCTDLVRRSDPAWPHLLAQLSRLRVRPGGDLLGWAAATVVQQVRAWSMTGAAETLGATVELRRDTWTLQQRRWPQHPDCGCAGWD